MKAEWGLCPECGKPVYEARDGSQACSDPECIFAHGIPDITPPSDELLVWMAEMRRRMDAWWAAQGIPASLIRPSGEPDLDSATALREHRDLLLRRLR